MTKNTCTATQIKLLRHRLKAYRERTPEAGRRCLSWENVACDIADATAYPVKMPVPENKREKAEKTLKNFGERLRQFVEGIRATGRGPAMLSAPALEAVRTFLVDDEFAQMIDRDEWVAQPRAGYISIMVRIPLEDVLERGAQALLDRIELEPMALVIDEEEGPGEEIGSNDAEDGRPPAA